TLSYLEALRWHLLTAVDLNTARIIQGKWLAVGLTALAIFVLLLLAVFTMVVERLLVRPLRGLHQSALALADGQFDVDLPPPGRDELGDRNRAFARMARQIKAHTDQLEQKVRQRTEALTEANAAMALAQKEIGDSIQYASLIQRAFLPDRQVDKALGVIQFVIWRQCDVVGGDSCLHRPHGDRGLDGGVDRAGHGVPGAWVAMLARAVLDGAVTRHGGDAPGRL